VSRAPRAVISGVGHSRVLRRAEVPLAQLAAEACRAAIADTGLDPSEIDGVACAPRQPVAGKLLAYDGIDFVSSDYVARMLGLRTSWIEDVTGFLINSLVAAVSAVAAGLCSHVLVCRSLHGSTGRYGHSDVSDAEGQAQFSAPYGVFVPGIWAQQWQRYRELYRAGSREQMAALVVQARQNGLLWEHGYWTQHKPEPLTREQYLAGGLVSTPLNIYDCDIPVHGAGAFVVSRPDSAGSLARLPAYIRGIAPPRFAEGRTKSPWPFEQEQESGRDVAGRLWRDCGLGPADVSLANLYDGFSFIAVLWLEAFGFCGPGEGFDFLQDGRIALDGVLPLNTSGGNLGAGRMHGVPHLMDAVLQVTGRAGPRQVRGASLALVTIGQQSGGGAVLLGAAQDLPRGHPDRPVQPDSFPVEHAVADDRQRQLCVLIRPAQPRRMRHGLRQ
jgi:acetyl-CoA acetyltransferase